MHWWPSLTRLFINFLIRFKKKKRFAEAHESKDALTQTLLLTQLLWTHQSSEKSPH